MTIGKLNCVGRPYEQVHVALTNYSSVPALHYEPFHTRLLLFGPKGRGFWSPVCQVNLASRLSDRRLIGICESMEFTCETYINILNVVACDYDRRQMTKVFEFLPFEIQRGKAYRFQYQFLVKGRK